MKNKVGRPKGTKDLKQRKPRIPIKTLAMIGKKFGKLTVLKLNEKFQQEMTKRNRRAMIDVVCDCGITKTIDAYSITKRKIISCGCAQRDSLIKRQYKGKQVSCINRLLSNYRASAKRRNLEITLTHEEIKSIIFKNCFYCDQIPYMTITTYSGTITYNGIDRIDNSIGYVIDNCVSSCKPCNMSKNNISKEMILKLYNYYYVK